MPVKQMALKRADRCRECGAELPVGTRAEWNSDLRVVTCVPCVEARPPAPMAPSDEMAAPAPPPGSVSSESVDSVVEEGPAPIDVGVPGASARQEHQRRQAKRERRIEEAKKKLEYPNLTSGQSIMFRRDIETLQAEIEAMRKELSAGSKP